jgi:hypothetical protein
VKTRQYLWLSGVLWLLLAGHGTWAESELSSPTIRTVDNPTARFDTLADELLQQTAPSIPSWKPLYSPKNAPKLITTEDVRPVVQPSQSVARSGPLPILQLPRNQPQMAGAYSTPLIKQSLQGANPQMVPVARQVIAAKPGDTAPISTLATVVDGPSNQSVATPPDVKKTDAASKPLPKTTEHALFAIPFIKVPGWLWGSMAAVCVGLALLTIACTVWLIQRMWQQGRVVKVAKAVKGLPPEPLPDTTEASLPEVPAIKAYATLPKGRRLISVSQLLQPTPNSVNGVLSQWVAQVSQVRQA